MKKYYHQEKEEYNLFEKHTDQCMQQMRKICQEHYAEVMELLKSIPDVNTLSAMIIIAETGGDMTVFENSGTLDPFGKSLIV